MSLPQTLASSPSRDRSLARCLVLTALCAMPPAYAQTVVPVDGQSPRPRGTLGLSVMGGGDRISSFEVNAFGGSTTTQSVRAGGSTDFRAGIDIPLTHAWGLQLTAGYVTGGIRADNGKATFTSMPLEAIGLYRFAPNLRFGLGVRAPLSSKYQEGGVAGVGRFEFDASITPVVEVEWLPRGGVFGLKLRGMNERYTEKRSGFKLDGNKVGLTSSYYF